MPLPALLAAAITFGEPAGVIITGESEIPDVIATGETVTFKIAVQNVGIPGELMVTISFTGPSTYSTSSDWFFLESGQKQVIDIPFRLPVQAPAGTYECEASLFGRGESF